MGYLSGTKSLVKIHGRPSLKKKVLGIWRGDLITTAVKSKHNEKDKTYEKQYPRPTSWKTYDNQRII